MKRAELKITGQVQGVFFRAFAQSKAQELGLKGWVRNEPDDSVKVIAEGQERKLKEFIEWCKEGSPSAKVDKVEVVWQEALGGFDRFEIRY